MAITEKDAEYKVGYRKPPKHARFQKGQSGNPRGSKAPQSLPEAAAALMRRKVALTLNGKTKRVPFQEALLLSQAQRGLAGNDRAAKLMIDLAQQAPPPKEIADTAEEVSQDFREALKDMTNEEIEIVRLFNQRLMAAKDKRRRK